MSELTAHIKQVLEQGFARVQVVGEVSRLTARASGHAYFTIKDANAALAAVIWKSTVVRLPAMPEEGQQYIFHGHLSLYAPQGRYQLVIS
ncbi:MAG: exodeoxyribonuclease VII large subunit, partial [Mariprofundaceae bacterium]